MPILIKPTLKCNQKCKYCYERNLINRELDTDKLKQSARELYEKLGRNIVIHGGEPLTLEKTTIEDLLQFSYELTGRSSIQTNGTLIDEWYIQLFKKYNTAVSISIDGLGECNEYRAGEEETEKIFNTVMRLKEEKIPVSVISTIHKANAGNYARLTLFLDFLKKLIDNDIQGRINPNFSQYSLDDETAIWAYKQIANFLIEHESLRKFSPFRDIISSLRDEPRYVCIFKECDIYHTDAAIVVLSDGMVTNCLRSRVFVRHPKFHGTRGELLQETKQENGGCKGCEFWEHCRGGCPSCTTDWRTRDRFCPVYYSLFKMFSKMLKSMGDKINDGGGNGTKKPRKHKRTEKRANGEQHCDGIVRKDFDGSMYTDSDNPCRKSEGVHE